MGEFLREIEAVAANFSFQLPSGFSYSGDNPSAIREQILIRLEAAGGPKP